MYGWWDVVCDSLTARSLDQGKSERLLIPITRRFVRAVIIAIGLLIALAMFFGTQTLTGLAAGLGVGGVILALAAKDPVENVFASLTLMFDMPFALGDWIKLDKVEGAVEEINLRSTRLRTADDTLVTVPNANLIKAPVENFGARRTRRQKLNLRLSYDCDPKLIDTFCDSLRGYLEGQPKVENGRTTVELDDPSETSIGVVVIWFLDVSSAAEEAANRHAFLDEALRQRTAQGLQFAAPLPMIP
jgi:MscS family membrane protein